MHLVCFTIEVHYDAARSYKSQIPVELANLTAMLVCVEKPGDWL